MEARNFKLTSYYDEQEILNQYLLFHYGEIQDQLPFSFGPKEALQFPQRCVRECLDKKSLPKNARALDLGCAVGGSSFELSRYCDSVFAIDKSQSFIDTAIHLQTNDSIECTVKDEGSNNKSFTIHLPKNVHKEKVKFLCADATNLKLESKFDVVLAANLICRLPHPKQFLKTLADKVNPQGQLILVSPYSWLEEFTSREEWLEGSSGLEALKDILLKDFDLKKNIELPFLLREHKRRYQWGVSQASIWIRKGASNLL